LYGSDSSTVRQLAAAAVCVRLLSFDGNTTMNTHGDGDNTVNDTRGGGGGDGDGDGHGDSEGERRSKVAQLSDLLAALLVDVYAAMSTAAAAAYNASPLSLSSQADFLSAREAALRLLVTTIELGGAAAVPSSASVVAAAAAALRARMLVCVRLAGDEADSAADELDLIKRALKLLK
jgi:hypothetical protein